MTTERETVEQWMERTGRTPTRCASPPPPTQQQTPRAWLGPPLYGRPGARLHWLPRAAWFGRPASHGGGGRCLL